MSSSNSDSGTNSQVLNKESGKSRSPLVTIFLTVFIYLIGFGIVIPMIPQMARSYGASSLQVGLVMSVFSLMQFLFAPFWGRLSDKYGRRPILLGCMVLEGFSYLYFGMSDDLTSIFIARALAGFFGASISTASAYVSDVTSKSERSKGMALIGAAFGLGFLIGPALGGALMWWGSKLRPENPNFGMHFACFAVAGICFLTALFGFKYLKESRVVGDNRHLQEKKNRLGALIKTFGDSRMATLLALMGLATTAMASMESILILWMQDKFKWTTENVSFGFAFIGLVAVITQGLLVRRLLPKLGERMMLLIGFSLFALSLALIPIVTAVPILAAVMAMLAVGQSFINPSVLGSVSLLSGNDEQGVNLGSAQSLSSLGRIIGPACGGAFYVYLNGALPFWFSAGLCIVAISLIIIMFQSLPVGAGKK